MYLELFASLDQAASAYLEPTNFLHLNRDEDGPRVREDDDLPLEISL
jgi:hypothetical protein